MGSRLFRAACCLSLVPLLVFCSPPPSDEEAIRPMELQSLSVVPSDLYVSERGSDRQPGTAADRPLRNIQTALDRAGAGTTIHVAPGTYHEQLVTRRGGAPGSELTLASQGGGAILDGSRLPWQSAANQNQALVELRHPYVRLEGFQIVHSKNSGVVLAADHLTVRGCEIAYAQRHAISTDTGRQPAADQPMIRDITLEGNRIHDTTLAGSGYGQAISLIAEDFVIRGNRVHANRDIGIDVWLGARHGEVVGNTVHDNRSTGIYVDGASYVRIHGNTVYANQHGIVLSSEDPRYDTRHVWVYNNLVYDHRQGAGCGTWDPDSGVQDAVFAFNTLVDNLRSFQLSGRDTTVEIASNLGYSTREALTDRTRQSVVKSHDNVWLPGPTGFHSVSGLDFSLTPDSAAIDRGRALAPLQDDRGRTFPITTDFAGQPRHAGLAPDAGAFELP